ncbi:molybdopterin-guanine dinucleotide biosynthesis protein MobA [Pseudobythopirellula maris]|uniref:Probable molybdenum cofactor guanylyltransferase n=1 Tax=Pseudobythopirellula maris TaxID=2527991 RepID=A0A5C5ZGT1_9BACT|nr:molybdenum cofactor guanylyltransferase [Pseudobythopirellula maris]TWT86267.1 molybdopterin-guanine dinucleotide biosynthesis protein MobA [Pseudobythopirellula maris]
MDGLGAIVLCGGRSSRMGADKATLRLPDGRTMLQAVLGSIGRVVSSGRMVCVAAEGQELGALPRDVAVAHDREPQRGPLEGFAAGLAALPAGVDRTLLLACDTPLLTARFCRLLVKHLSAEHDAVVPVIEGCEHPLTAAYRTGVREQVEAMLAADRLRARDLLAELRVRAITADEARAVDPSLGSLRSCNTPEELSALLETAAKS